jgi:hypothetical protein
MGLRRKTMRKIVAILMCVIICMSLIGCAELIDTRHEIVDVTIVDEYHRGAYTTFMYTGKVMMPISHAPTYRIVVEYDGIKYSFSGRETYNEYHDKIGSTVSATLRTRIYDDGTVKRDITTIGVEVS